MSQKEEPYASDEALKPASPVSENVVALERQGKSGHYPPSQVFFSSYDIDKKDNGQAKQRGGRTQQEAIRQQIADERSEWEEKES